MRVELLLFELLVLEVSFLGCLLVCLTRGVLLVRGRRNLVAIMEGHLVHLVLLLLAVVLFLFLLLLDVG